VKIAFDENIPASMVRVFETFATERQLKKLTGNFDIESAKLYTPEPQEDDYIAKNDVPWIRRFAHAGGRIIISGNTNMRNVPHERLALIENGMIVIFFESRWNNWGFFDKCSHLMHWWPVIAKKVKTAPKGSFWYVPLNWTASDKGRLRKVSNRDPQELKIERRAKARLERIKRRRPVKRPIVDDLFSKGNGQ
jgi:PIN like domain